MRRRFDANRVPSGRVWIRATVAGVLSVNAMAVAAQTLIFSTPNKTASPSAAAAPTPSGASIASPATAGAPSAVGMGRTPPAVQAAPRMVTQPASTPTAAAAGRTGGRNRPSTSQQQATALRDRLEAEIQNGQRSVALLLAERGGTVDTADALVKLALERNPLLLGQQQAVQAGLAQVKEAAANGSPSVALNARVSVAEGGRTFEIPTGDVLNPVYRNLEALNQRQGIPVSYPTLQNQTLSLLRPREQDTRVVLTAPLYAPTLEPRVKAAGAAAVAASAGMESVARHLVRDVKVAWHGMHQALAQKQVFQASEALLTENLRVYQVLLEEGKVTRDAVLRAEAELLAVQQAVAEAQFQADNAARRLNVLTARPLDTEIRIQLEPAVSATTAGAQVGSAVSMQDFQLPPELRQVLAGVQARKSLEEAARKNFQPTVGLAVEAGYQGTDYSTGSGTGVAIASVVLNWRFSDGGLRDAQLGAAMAARRQLELQEEEAKAQLEGILRGAGERLSLSLQQVRNAQARQRASEEAFRIASLKRDAGALTQLEYFDAQRVLTDSRSAAVTAQAQLNVAIAEFELAKSAYPLPAQWLQLKEESVKK